ncbi:MAG: FKBP-type peptidyl-prolyl cis-trans isomerase [Magnetococcales bacterium]|nr:FKBP-type peptidyl-prolyl cis-trans isomerase [Magnetococcales bacterium]
MLVNFFLGRKKAAYHRQRGDAYRKENGQRPGVTTLHSGLQYEVLHQGNGQKPSYSSRVQVHYRGTLVNGAEFDSSYARGEPLSFNLLEVISGWREGVQLMAEGSKFRFVIPPEIAYGSTGAGLIIGPDSTLIFEIELLKIEDMGKRHNLDDD